MKLVLMAIILVSFKVSAAELNLYAIDSPTRLNWKTPKKLLKTTLRNYMRIGHGKRSRHKIGHAYLGFKCDGEVEVISGMTSGKGFKAKESLLKDKVGMSVILIDNNGHFQNHAESSKDIKIFSDTNRISKLQIEITNDQCLLAKQWHEEYSNSESFIYGGVDKRPLRGEGSGCTAYAMSFFEVANVDFNFFNKLFLRTIYIPNDLLGGDYGLGEKVKVKKILADRRLLSVSTPDSLQVDLYDPNDMHEWIKKTWKDVEEGAVNADIAEYNAKAYSVDKMKVLKLKKKDL